MEKLAKAGWKIGLRFDPLIYHENYQASYKQLFEDVFCVLDRDSVHSVSFGPLRFPPAMFEKIRKLYPAERLFAGPLVKDRQMVSYSKPVEDEMADFCREELERFIPDSKFFACTPGGPG
jgi:spore photoproduct lyase